MSIKAEVLQQLDSLIAEGSRLEQSYSMDMGMYFPKVPEHEFRTLATESFATIAWIAGEQSQYFRLLPKQTEKIAHDPSTLASVLGTLKALRKAIDKDLLVSLESRLRANIHDDFLQQAKTLFEERYHVAAMVLVGGVMEDHLEKLCTKHGKTWTGHGNIAKYNDALKDTAYDKATWRRVQGIGDLRNDAAHGDGAKVKPEDVEDALKYVGRFIADNPA
jgi:hypothetical protein